MAYKRNIDRLPIIPADAKVHNVTCHFCIVGCGYHAYTWPVNKQGGTEPSQNIFKARIFPSSKSPRPRPGSRPRCTTSSSRTGATCILSSSPTRPAR